MIPSLTADELTLLREALIALRRQQAIVTNFGSRFLQGTAQTALMVKAGDRTRDIDTLDFRLREAHAQLTGAPRIQHGNADIHDPAMEAQEANVRG